MTQIRSTKSNRIEEALTALEFDRVVVVVDDEDRENEDDLISSAEHATLEKVAFIVRWSSGLICAVLPGDRLNAFELPLMVVDGTDAMGTTYTVTGDQQPGQAGDAC